MLTSNIQVCQKEVAISNKVNGKLTPDSDWIEESESNTSAYCMLCKKDVDLRTIGITAIQSHAKARSIVSCYQVNAVLISRTC